MKKLLLLLSLIIPLLAVMATMATAAMSESKPARSTPSGAADALPTCNGRIGENLLANPSFEAPYAPPPADYHPDCIWAGNCLTAITAKHWLPWWQSHDDNDEVHIINMPEWKAADRYAVDPARVLTGEYAQQYFTTFSTFKAGVFQSVPVEENGEYVFSVWGHAWSQGKNDPDHYSGPEYGNLYQMVGINPTGSTDWAPWIEAEILQDNSGGPMVWGEMRIQYDIYDTFEVTATAQAPTITVVLWARPEWAVKDNNAYWEDACLVQRKMEVQRSFNFTVGADLAPVTAISVPISLSGSEEMTWTATVSPTGTLPVTLYNNSGQAGDTLGLALNSLCLPAGTYTTALTITAHPPVPGSPAIIPITLAVASDPYCVLLPSIFTPDTP